MPDATKRAAMRECLAHCLVSIFNDGHRAEVERLAGLYVAKAIVPAAKTADALHVAYAVVHGMDILLSWNFRHLANVRKEALFASVNMEQGYRQPLRLLSPLEVEDER
jgi:uncharacterized membrane-anchored protein